MPAQNASSQRAQIKAATTRSASVGFVSALPNKFLKLLVDFDRKAITHQGCRA
jgi:hypothetical protein